MYQVQLYIAWLLPATFIGSNNQFMQLKLYNQLYVHFMQAA